MLIPSVASTRVCTSAHWSEQSPLPDFTGSLWPGRTFTRWLSLEYCMDLLVAPKGRRSFLLRSLVGQGHCPCSGSWGCAMMLLAGLHGRVAQLSGLQVEARPLRGLSNGSGYQVGPLAELYIHLWFSKFASCVPCQVGVTGWLHNWAGLLAGLCSCSWLSGNSDRALQLYGGCGWTLVRQGHRQGFMVRQDVLCDQTGPRAVSQSPQGPQAGLCSQVGC